ncbi:UNVERIFIED_CONTAM: hypothetical protein Sradi_2087100 [Sesamum radiatum]|uniref:Uncharacterized protein n=1 Tax=Sesamum radiatum TaxID=300843 RepID=A0AAW2TJY0_SESRA
MVLQSALDSPFSIPNNDEIFSHKLVVLSNPLHKLVVLSTPFLLNPLHPTAPPPHQVHYQSSQFFRQDSQGICCLLDIVIWETILTLFDFSVLKYFDEIWFFDAYFLAFYLTLLFLVLLDFSGS